MAGEWQDRKVWKGSLQWESLFLEDIFPSRAYHESLWAEWESRIQNGQQAELDRVVLLQTEWKEDLKTRPHNEIADRFTDDAFQAVRLTNTMYAAIIVSLWSNLEHLLKRITFTCHKALQLDGKVPVQFGKIMNLFSQHLSIELSAIDGYAKINAVRILNNSFKHGDGRYTPEAAKSYTQIDQALLDAWSILDDKRAAVEGGCVIDYSKVPIQELVAACNMFCCDLLRAVGIELDNCLGDATHGS